MFASQPPSSPDPTKTNMPKRQPLVGGFRRFLLQIAGANTAGADRA
jgi:hypothetical protein